MTPENEAVLTLPVLPLKNTVLFPHLFMPLSVGRPNSVAAVEAVLATRGQEPRRRRPARRPATISPAMADLYTVGTRAVVKKMARGESGVELLVQGVERVVLLKIEQTEPFLKAPRPRLAAARGRRHRGRSALPRRAGTGRAALWNWRKGRAADQRRSAGRPGRRPAALGLPDRLDAQPGRAEGAGAAGGQHAAWRRCG